jgi:hypothetical protein
MTMDPVFADRCRAMISRTFGATIGPDYGG